MSDHNYDLNDIIIINVGAAGLNAAFILPRCMEIAGV
jgi:thioredoxin reductase